MSKTCRDCHFLTKEYRGTGAIVHSFSLNADERKNLPAPVAHHSLRCHAGVWDEGLGMSRLEVTAEVDRPGRSTGCFFFPHRPAMLLPAAAELEKREAEHRRIARSHLLTQIGLAIAGAALVANILLALARSR